MFQLRSAFLMRIILTCILVSNLIISSHSYVYASDVVNDVASGAGDAASYARDGVEHAASDAEDAATGAYDAYMDDTDGNINEDMDLGDQVMAVMDTLSRITCETQVAMQVLRGRFTHTCMQSTYTTLAVANIVSPLLYAMTMAKLRLQDDTGELFDGQDCDYRTSFDDPKLSFAFCSNWKMLAVQTIAAGIGAYVIFDALLSGDNVWNRLSGVFTDHPKLYSKVYMNQSVGTEGKFIDVTGGFPWKVVRDRDTVCLATKSFGGWIPVGCRFIAEPFPVSQYEVFFTGASTESKVLDSPSTRLLDCSHLGPCYKRARDHSLAVVSITSPIVECVRDSLVKLLASRSVCSFDEVRNFKRINTGSIIFEFQKKMHMTVTALLTMYIVFFGFRILMGGGVPGKSEIVTFVVKFILVTYFAVGISTSGGSESYSGMMEWIFPLIFNGSAQLASMVMGTGGINGLCEFHAADYLSGYGHLALWDAIDCRLGHYLGIDMIVDIRERAKSGGGVGFSIPPYFVLLVPAAFMGNIMLVMIIIMYPILVIAVCAYLVNSFVVGLLITTILGVMAPLFVPCVLFERTKQYFSNWSRLMMSFMLQPMIVTVFLLTMFSVYDVGFFGSCIYTPKNTVIDSIERTYYVLDVDESHYQSYDHLRECKSSLGWILNAITTFNVGAVVEVVQGLFTNSVSVTFEKIVSFIYSLLTACLILVLIYYMTGNLIDFAADLSMGMSLSGVAVGADQLANAMKDRVQQAMENMKSDGKDDGEGGEDGKGEEGEGKGSEDSMSSKSSSSQRTGANSGDSMSSRGGGSNSKGGGNSGGGDSKGTKALSGSKNGGGGG